jgi:hypothetical protein
MRRKLSIQIERADLMTVLFELCISLSECIRRVGLVLRLLISRRLESREREN